MERFENIEQAKEFLMQKAIANEYMYAMLKEQGIAARLDEKITFEFIDMHESEKKHTIASESAIIRTTSGTNSRTNSSHTLLNTTNENIRFTSVNDESLISI